MDFEALQQALATTATAAATVATATVVNHNGRRQPHKNGHHSHRGDLPRTRQQTPHRGASHNHCLPDHNRRLPDNNRRLTDHNRRLSDHNRRLPAHNRCLLDHNQPLQPPPASSGLCFYHYNFRAQAKKCRQPCAWRTRPGLGKRIAAPAVIYATTPTAGDNLIYLKDSRTHTRYLVDTGAALSLLPHRSPEPASGPPLVSASGLPICTGCFQKKF